MKPSSVVQGNFGPKGLAVLELASMQGDDDRRWKKHQEACDLFGEAVVIAKFEALAARGYIDYGVSARTGWLTDKGQAAWHIQKSS